MRPKLPQLFGRLPKAPLVVMPVPDYAEKDQAAAYYIHGTPDGSRPGTVFVNTYKFATRPLYLAESIAYHEGLPGHHLQISIAQELTGLPEFRKYTYYTAYTEGWGLYAERLGKEDRLLPGSVQRLWPSGSGYLACRAPGRRYRRPLAALDTRADG